MPPGPCRWVSGQKGSYITSGLRCLLQPRVRCSPEGHASGGKLVKKVTLKRVALTSSFQVPKLGYRSIHPVSPVPK